MSRIWRGDQGAERGHHEEVLAVTGGRLRRGARWLVGGTVGVVRAREWRNIVLTSTRVPWIRRIESREAARAVRMLGGPPWAEVACIVPTYQRPDGVYRAVQSILAQTFQNFVVLVVDDGAGQHAVPDDPRVHVVTLSRNTGIAGVVRNVGIRCTRSRFVAFLDDDNEWEPTHLERSLATLERGGDLVYSRVARYWPDGVLIDTVGDVFDRRRMLNESYIDTNAIVVRRSPHILWSRLPRGRRTLPVEDWAYVFRLSKHRRVAFADHIGVRYLVNPDSYFSDWSYLERRPEA